ncbi:hypothetical protein Golob_004692, partial [Gossypium lobatum]|nr:hypothetical protein [Gossypium lobatum]
MSSATLPTVEFTTGINSSDSNSGVGRAMKKKSTLLGASSENKLNVFMEENFALTEGDVLAKVVKGVALITFSNRVQELIQLMDLENNLFLIRFQDENDYNKALVGEGM